MSSILKALKRLENEQPQQDDGQSQIRKIDTKKTMNKRAKGTWLFNRVLSLSFIFIFLVVGGWFLFSNKTRLINMFSPEDTPPESHNNETETSFLQRYRKCKNGINIASSKSQRNESKRNLSLWS